MVEINGSSYCDVFALYFSSIIWIYCIMLVITQDENDLDEMNIEILRNKLYKAYLEDFYGFCEKLGGATADVMCPILAVSVVIVQCTYCTLY